MSVKSTTIMTLQSKPQPVDAWIYDPLEEMPEWVKIAVMKYPEKDVICTPDGEKAMPGHYVLNFDSGVCFATTETVEKQFDLIKTDTVFYEVAGAHVE